MESALSAQAVLGSQKKRTEVQRYRDFQYTTCSQTSTTLLAAKIPDPGGAFKIDKSTSLKAHSLH